MPVIQISRVQVRRGQTSQTGFPQLASGEFGWSIDQQELYIGNGAVSEGAPAIGNTRLITEHDSNFFLVTSPTYIYKNSPNGPTVQTGPVSNPFVLRFIQDKLDDRVNLRDFDAVGDGVTDDTDALKRAVIYTAQNKKVLDLNEGTFLIRSTILVPPFAELRGAGIGKTTILTTSTTAIFQTVGSNLSTTINDVASASQTPRDVRIQGITFTSVADNAPEMVNLVGVTNGTVDGCEFKANTAIASTSSMAAGIRMTAVGTVACNHLAIKNCVFNYMGSAIVSDHDANNIDIHANRFANVDGGIIFNKNLQGGPGRQYGPMYVDVNNNEFDNINNQGIFVGQNLPGYSYVHSSNNLYNNVGIGYNNTLGELQSATDIITFKTFENSSDNDQFTRINKINSTPLVNFVGTIKPIVNGPVILQGILSNGAITVLSQTTKQVFLMPRQSYIAGNLTVANLTIKFDYTVTKSGNLIRQGVLEVNINNNTGEYLMDDKFTCTGNSDGDLVFSVDLTRSDVTIINATNNGNLSCSITYSVYVRQ